MNESNAPIDVVCAIIARGNSVLIARHPPGHRHAKKWEFPGGKIEHGETPLEAIVREIREELAVEVSAHGILGSFPYQYPWIHINLIPVICSIGNNASPNPLEHATIHWATVQELVSTDFCEADIPIRNMIIDKKIIS